jgi:excisionase family DNA binding protein
MAGETAAAVKRALTLNEFMDETGMKQTTTRKLIRSGKLPVIRAETRILIARETLEAFLRGELNTAADTRH